ncbi:major facilitator superfamily domain-containing protein 5 [Hibiscus syriacus]|uniref:Major facilitator superfamily domain-containing protein 5 n=1 Tax=Hibiscus syriacus TaxID=106335 RepID=A0A6A2ZE94_HIBSY|nr:major facilitator superfamily domain-containing protein 5 [Hibiscus syriacus]
MANLRNHLFCAFQFLLLLETKVLCYQYKLGDSLLFLYPPSQDSVIQVTEQSYNTCNLKDPILYMNNGDTLFNITKPGEYFFTSGTPGHCEKKQKLYIAVLSGNGSASAPSALPDTASSPSYPTVFGSIPQPPSSLPSSSPCLSFSTFITAVVAAAWVIFNALM